MIVEGIRICQHTAVEFAQGDLCLLVVADEDAVLLQFGEGRFGHGIFHLPLLHEPIGGLGPYEQEGNHERIVFDVGCPHVQSPGDVVEGVQEDVVGSPRVEEVPQASQALDAAFAGVDREYRGLGDARSVRPDSVQQVRDAHYVAGCAVGVDGLLDAGDEDLPYADAVHRKVDLVFIRELLREPPVYGHLLRNAHLVQFHPGAFKLLHGLDEVAGVCPQPRMVQSHHHVACLAGESSKPLHAFPALCGIFAPVRVGACQYHGVPSAAAHH